MRQRTIEITDREIAIRDRRPGNSGGGVGGRVSRLSNPADLNLSDTRYKHGSESGIELPGIRFSREKRRRDVE